MSIRIGIIGFGKMGLLHGALLNQLRDVELVAIADTSRLVLRAFRSVLPNIRYYHSYEKMLDAEGSLDAVVVATPIFSHAPILSSVVNRGVHVFIEKPLAMTYEEAKTLGAALDPKADLVVQVGFDHRWMPTVGKCKNLLENGAVGSINQVKAEMYSGDVLSPQKGWRYDPKTSGGGVLIDFTVHLIDLLYWFFGDIGEVSMNSKSVFSEKVEDEIEGNMVFKKGVGARIRSSWSSREHRKSYTRIEIQGENGTIVVTDQTIEVSYDKVKERYSDPDLYTGYFMDIAGPHFSLQLEDFVRCIREKARPRSDVNGAIYVQKIVDTMYRSANLGRSLKVDETIGEQACRSA